MATDKVNNAGDWVEAGPVTVKSVTKYYSHGNSRVAMRRGDVVYYLPGDHPSTLPFVKLRKFSGQVWAAPL